MKKRSADAQVAALVHEPLAVILTDAKPVASTPVQIAEIITLAVKANPECSSFVGVIVEKLPKEVKGNNWAIQGIKYGKAPRNICQVSIEKIVHEMRGRYIVGDLT